MCHVVLQAFGVSPAEATLMDPQQRLLLHSMADLGAWDAAILGQSSAASTPHHRQHLGVYVGVSQLEYGRMCLEHQVPLTAYYATGGSGAFLVA